MWLDFYLQVCYMNIGIDNGLVRNFSRFRICRKNQISNLNFFDRTVTIAVSIIVPAAKQLALNLPFNAPLTKFFPALIAIIAYYEVATIGWKLFFI